MPYRVYLFANAQLPSVGPKDDLSTGEVESALVDSVGGAFDYWGDNKRSPKKHIVAVKGQYLGANFAALRTQVDALKYWLGQRSNLHRRREEDGADQIKRARLMKVLHERELNDTDRIAEITAIFESDKPNWYSELSTVVSQSLSSNPQSVAVSNAGTMDINDAIIKVTASGGGITALAVTATNAVGHINFSWTGTLTSGHILEIDCGAKTIRNNGVDAYNGVTIGNDHTVPGWFCFAASPAPPTVTTLSVAHTGNGTFRVETYDQWQ